MTKPIPHEIKLFGVRCFARGHRPSVISEAIQEQFHVTISASTVSCWNPDPLLSYRKKIGRSLKGVKLIEAYDKEVKEVKRAAAEAAQSKIQFKTEPMQPSNLHAESLLRIEPHKAFPPYGPPPNMDKGKRENVKRNLHYAITSVNELLDVLRSGQPITSGKTSDIRELRDTLENLYDKFAT